MRKQPEESYEQWIDRLQTEVREGTWMRFPVAGTPYSYKLPRVLLDMATGAVIREPETRERVSETMTVVRNLSRLGMQVVVDQVTTHETSDENPHAKKA